MIEPAGPRRGNLLFSRQMAGAIRSLRLLIACGKARVVAITGGQTLVRTLIALVLRVRLNYSYLYFRKAHAMARLIRAMSAFHGVLQPHSTGFASRRHFGGEHGLSIRIPFNAMFCRRRIHGGGMYMDR